MRYILSCLLLFLLPGSQPSFRDVDTPSAYIADDYQFYLDLDLTGKVSFEAFEQALEGYRCIEIPHKDTLALIDFSKPSTEERLYVLDLAHRKLLIASHVTHGEGSGELYATKFSNIKNSHQTSLGFYITSDTYTGGNGYSLLIHGLEKGINDQAQWRGIVIHPADYANPSVIASSGRLGRSHGCPALPEALSPTIIDLIKNGSLMYIYADCPNYLAQSPVLLGK